MRSVRLCTLQPYGMERRGIHAQVRAPYESRVYKIHDNESGGGYVLYRKDWAR